RDLHQEVHQHRAAEALVVVDRGPGRGGLRPDARHDRRGGRGDRPLHVRQDSQALHRLQPRRQRLADRQDRRHYAITAASLRYGYSSDSTRAFSRIRISPKSAIPWIPNGASRILKISMAVIVVASTTGAGTAAQPHAA